MISKELLLRKGSIEALLALSGDDELTTTELADEMDVADSTARERMTDLADEGLVQKDAALRGEDPVRVYQSTEDGTKLANSLESILDYEDDESDSEATAEAEA